MIRTLLATVGLCVLPLASLAADKPNPIITMSQEELVALRNVEIVCAGIGHAALRRIRADVITQMSTDEVDDGTKGLVTIYIGVESQEMKALILIEATDKRLVDDFKVSKEDALEFTADSLKASSNHFDGRYEGLTEEAFIKTLSADFDKCLSDEKKIDPLSSRS